MGYIWLKKFSVGLADAYPYFKVVLEIQSPWDYPAPFYTFAVQPRIGRREAPSNYGWYLYVGEELNKVIEPKTVFSIEAYLRLIDIHAQSLRSALLDYVSKGVNMVLQANAYVYLLNYQQGRICTSRTISPNEVREWLERPGDLRNDFCSSSLAFI